jgi:hypothetical protein
MSFPSHDCNVSFYDDGLLVRQSTPALSLHTTEDLIKNLRKYPKREDSDTSPCPMCSKKYLITTLWAWKQLRLPEDVQCDWDALELTSRATIRE